MILIWLIVAVDTRVVISDAKDVLELDVEGTVKASDMSYHRLER